jgi:hypothetical protein
MFQMAHVRDVANIANLIVQVLQIAEKEVEGDGRACMAQVGITIDSRAADIHADTTRSERLEEFLLPAQCIINKKWLFHIVNVQKML